MPITYVGSAVRYEAVPVSQVTVGRPEGTQENDLLVAHVSVWAGSTPTITPPPGWELVTSQSLQPNHPLITYIYKKVAGASEPSTYTWSLNIEVVVAVAVVAYRGASAGVTAGTPNQTDFHLTIPVTIPPSTQGDPSITVSFAAIKDPAYAPTQTGQGADTFELTTTTLKELTDSGAGTEQFSLTAQILLDDSGTGTEQLSLTTQIPLDDSGTGTEQLSLTAQIPLDDSGTGSEQLSLTAQISLDDSGSGTEQLSLTAQILLDDSGVGVDILSLEGATTLLDQGFGSDTLTLTAYPVLDDTGYGTDIEIPIKVGVDGGVGSDALVPTKVTVDEAVGSDGLVPTKVVADSAAATDESVPTKAVADSAAGTEVLLVTATTVTEDSGVGSDTLTQQQLAASIELLDTGAGADTLTVTTVTTVSLDDSGVGAEVIAITATTTTADSGVGTDLLLVQAYTTAEDIGGATDTFVVTKQVEDSAVATDIFIALKQLSDAAAGADTFSLQVTITVTDTGGSSEHLAITTTTILEDSGSGADIALVPSSILILDDAASGSDTADVTATTWVEDTGAATDHFATTAYTTLTDTSISTDILSSVAYPIFEDIGAAADLVQPIIHQVSVDEGMGAELLAPSVVDIPLAIERAFDHAKLTVEQFLLEMLKREWQYVGNIKVERFALAHTVMERLALPAIVVGFIPPVRFRGTIGALIPILRFTIVGAIPWIGTPQAREQLLVMGERIATILQRNYRSPYWNELHVEQMQVVGSNEKPPQWEAVTITVSVFHKPIKLAGVPHEIVPDNTTGVADPLLAAERYLAHIVRTEWERHGNIRIKGVVVARTLVSELSLPAIVVGLVPPYERRPVIGGEIPVARFIVAGLVPWVGTVEARLELQKMACRLAGILLSHHKTSRWHNLEIVNVQVMGGEEQPPRWEAVTITCDAYLNPITLTSVMQQTSEEGWLTDALLVSAP